MPPKVIHSRPIHRIKRLLLSNPILFPSAFKQFCDKWPHLHQVSHGHASANITYRGNVPQPIIATARCQHRPCCASQQTVACLQAPPASLDWRPSLHRASHIQRAPPSHAPGRYAYTAHRPPPTPTHANGCPQRHSTIPAHASTVTWSG